MEIPLLQIVSLASGAGRLLNNIVYGTKNSFDSILGTFLPGARGRGFAKGNLLFPVPPRATSMDKDLLRQVLASGSGLLMFHFAGMMKKMGVDVNTLMSMLTDGPGGISDSALKAIMMRLGFGKDKIYSILSSKDLKEDVKAKIFSVIHDRLLQECNKEGIDIDTFIEQVKHGQVDIARLKAVVDAQAPLGDDTLLDTENSLRDIIRSAISHAHLSTDAKGLGDVDGMLTAGELDNILNTLKDTLDIDKDTLKNLLFSTQEDKRNSAIDKVMKAVSRYLKTHRQEKTPRNVLESLGFLKSITDQKEWSGIEKVIKTWHADLVGLVASIKLDKPMFMLLAEKMGENPSSVFSKDVSKVIDQLRLAIPQHVKNGEGKLSVKLYPPMLGRVDISLTMHDGNVSAVFRTEHAFTRDILHHHIPFLREALSEQGIRINHFTVTTSLGSDNPHSGNGYAFTGNNGRSWPGYHTAFGNKNLLGPMQEDYLSGLSRPDMIFRRDGIYKDGLDIFV